MTLPNDVALLSAVVILTSADVTLDTEGRDCSFKGRTYINYNKDLLSDSLTNAVKSNFNEAGDQNECWDRMENVQESFLIKIA